MNQQVAGQTAWYNMELKETLTSDLCRVRQTRRPSWTAISSRGGSPSQAELNSRASGTTIRQQQP